MLTPRKYTITKLVLFICLQLIYSSLFSQNISVKECFDNAITPVADINPSNTNFSDLRFLKKGLKNKRIIILGESGHGDGSTFEAKTRLIEYLVNELGFNTIAFEGGGFWEMYYAWQNILNGKDTKSEIYNSWFSLWSLSQQTQELIKFIASNKSRINILGIDNQPGNQYSPDFASILDSLVGQRAFKGVDYNFFKRNFYNYYLSIIIDTSYKSKVDISQLKKDLKTIRKNLSVIKTKNAEAMLQGVVNIEGFMRQITLNSGTYSDQNKSIGLRDSLMAQNVIWYLNHHPDMKLIIWTANLHAARNLNQVIYKNNDDFYQTFIPLGRHLYNKYKKKVFSIAFTSVSGKSSTIYQQVPSEININKNSFDYQLGQITKNDFCFVDFQRIQKKKTCRQKSFSSTILGYNNHYGKWFNVFDGVFFIRKMKISRMIE